MAAQGFDVVPGTSIVIYLQSPKEKVWGILISITTAGVVVRGLDLVIFDDWMRQEARGQEALLGPATLFYPMHRLERLEKDESQGILEGYADRFLRETGRTVSAALGLDPDEGA